MYTIRIHCERPDDTTPALGPWTIAASILELIEDGASRHCIRRTVDKVDRNYEDHTFHHHRLDATITVRIPTTSQDHRKLQRTEAQS